MYRVSTVGIMMTLTFLVLMSLIGSGNAARANAVVGCLNYQFMNNGSCHPCSNNCKACASETNCTVCQRGFFGTVCEKNCYTNCTGTCHKKYGHCTYGCPDGTYPADDNSCQPCPDHCLICGTLSECVLYKKDACRLSCHGNCTNCNRATGQCTQCNSLLSQHDTQRSTNDGNDSSTNHVTTIILVIVGVFVGVFVAVGGSSAVFLLYRKRCSANASIKRETALKETSSTDKVQIDLPCQIFFQEDNTTDPLVINIQGTEILKVEERVGDRDANKTEDDISDKVPDIEGKTGTDTDPERNISDLDYYTKLEIKQTETQRDGSAHYESLFYITTPAPHKYPKKHRTRASNPYPKPTYKDNSGEDHTQCRTQYTIWKQEYTPILPEERREVKYSEVFGKSYNDQLERFTS